MAATGRTRPGEYRREAAESPGRATPVDAQAPQGQAETPFAVHAGGSSMRELLPPPGVLRPCTPIAHRRPPLSLSRVVAHAVPPSPPSLDHAARADRPAVPAVCDGGLRMPAGDRRRDAVGVGSATLSRPRRHGSGTLSRALPSDDRVGRSHTVPHGTAGAAAGDVVDPRLRPFSAAGSRHSGSCRSTAGAPAYAERAVLHLTDLSTPRD